MDENVLKHFGILGMKWGVRRPVGKNGLVTNSDDFNESRNLKKKPVSSLTNAELKKLNERLQLEQNYKNLSKQNISKGKKMVQDILSSSGKQLAGQFANKAGAAVLKYVTDPALFAKK